MKYRVYISDMGSMATGYVDEETLSEVEKYQSFFTDNDDNGKGFFEVELPSITEKENGPVYLRATSDEIRFGCYDPEGWHPIHRVHTSENGDCQVVFDSMVTYYAYEDLVNEDYDGYLSTDEVKDSLHPEDVNVFENLFEEYKSEKEEEEV